MTRKRVRLDKLLVERGLVASRSIGQVLIMAGEVRVGGETAVKPSVLVPADADVEIVEPMPYVSRGGQKLAAAIDEFAITISGKTCADVGACTGGFTDVLLQNGARLVYAIDVGYGQLDWKLRQDKRVVIMERTNARYLESLPEQIDVLTIDVSFISLKLILESALNWLAAGANIISLIKPQFEAGREQVGKGGVVRDARIHAQVLEDILAWSQAIGLSIKGLIPSPVVGAKGNKEFLVWHATGPVDPVDINRLVHGVLKL